MSLFEEKNVYRTEFDDDENDKNHIPREKYIKLSGWLGCSGIG